MINDNGTQIQLLSPSVLSEYPKDARFIDTMRKGLFKEIGWHYWVDLTWILAKLRELNIPKGATVLDAGAGYGLLQFALAFAGYQVISVDFSNRKARFPHKMIFSFDELRNKSDFNHIYIEQVKGYNQLRYHPKRLLTFFRNNWEDFFFFANLMWKCKFGGNVPGRITLYHADIKNMQEIQNSSVDAVVSCSVIEHLQLNDVPVVLNEFCRVLKPTKPMIITTSASKGPDWFHEPSLGWCYSRRTLSTIFEQTAEQDTEFENFDTIQTQYQESKILRNLLPSSYFVSGNNGMPWGDWNPVYVPVGIIKRNP